VTIDPRAVAERLTVIRQRIETVVGAVGAADVEVLAVTKAFGSDAVHAAMAAGCRAVGENYAQELAAKFADLEPRPEVHFIGQLQTNKVRLVAPFVTVYETVDRLSLATEIAKRAPGARVLVQVDTSNEPGKGGCPVAEVASLVDTCRGLGLQVEGLMTVGPTEGGPEAARPGFCTVRQLVDALGLTVCSMGMSDDLEVAVSEGSTEVRVGSALFGSRPPRG
jgi:pyridoxal phosphate enzyme (YggS family)